MRLNLNDTTIYATEFTLSPVSFTPHNTMHEMEIKEGYMDIDISRIPQAQECAKTEREKVWEMAKAMFLPTPVGMQYDELEDCFGTKSITCILKNYSADEALEKYESWKKENDVEALVKSLKPQDVVAVPSPVDNSVKNVMMITMLEHPSSLSYRMQGIDSDGCTVYLVRKIEEYKGIEKIGRVVETTDILGEIKKIEDEWRKNN